jgi:hypothetical protein
MLDPITQRGHIGAAGGAANRRIRRENARETPSERRGRSFQMPWNDQSSGSGGGQGPWGGGPRRPWGQPPRTPPQQGPDLEEMLRQWRERFRFGGKP